MTIITQQKAFANKKEKMAAAAVKKKSIVLLIDTTGSMHPFIEAIRRNIIEVLDMCTIMGVDVGIMAYKDYDAPSQVSPQIYGI